MLFRSRASANPDVSGLKQVLACAERACSESFADEVIFSVTSTVKELLGARSVALALLDRESSTLAIVGAQGLSRQFVRAYRRTVGTHVVGEVIWNDRKVFLERPDTESGEYADLKMELDYVSVLCVRVTIGGRPLGFLWADSEQPGRFQEQHLVLLRLLADLAALAVERDRMVTSARQNTSLVGTGQVCSYSYFHRRLTEEIERAQRLNERMSLLLVAEDHLGDQAPVDRTRMNEERFSELVGQVKGATRSIDVIGRYGADQLVLYLPETSQDAALKAAERICRTVEHGGGRTDGPARTVSIGVATLPENGETVDQLMNALTSALFKAQRAGGNRVSGPAEMYVI